MRAIIYTIYDKVADLHTDPRVGINRATVCRQLKNELTESVAKGTTNPEDFSIHWVGNYDTEADVFEKIKENADTEMAEIFERHIDINEG